MISSITNIHVHVPQLGLPGSSCIYLVPDCPSFAPHVSFYGTSWATWRVKQCSIELDIQKSKRKRLSTKCLAKLRLASYSSRTINAVHLRNRSKIHKSQGWKCSWKLLRLVFRLEQMVQKEMKSFASQKALQRYAAIQWKWPSLYERILWVSIRLHWAFVSWLKGRMCLGHSCPNLALSFITQVILRDQIKAVKNTSHILHLEQICACASGDGLSNTTITVRMVVSLNLFRHCSVWMPSPNSWTPPPERGIRQWSMEGTESVSAFVVGLKKPA